MIANISSSPVRISKPCKNVSVFLLFIQLEADLTKTLFLPVPGRIVILSLESEIESS